MWLRALVPTEDPGSHNPHDGLQPLLTPASGGPMPSLTSTGSKQNKTKQYPKTKTHKDLSVCLSIL